MKVPKNSGLHPKKTKLVTLQKITVTTPAIFLDCIKSKKQPIADLESSHKVAIACHLANISLKTGRKITWDADKEQIMGDPKANEMLVRPYRAPWDKELKALLQA